MPLRFVLDEHLRGSVWDLIQRHNLLREDPIDVARVGDPEDLPLSISDPQILQWAERERRILISRDKSTMPTHLAQHLAAGHHSPGVMILKPHLSMPRLLDFLVLAAYASEPHEWENRISFVP
ncbi:MAG: hypothetical protein JWO87_1290 [Phycisphaerales bacterium]|nr:hypothetical protein [Phycisphaerales bacterium]